ncbi:MAG: SDR family oxidoreductase [Sphingomonadales bacterium]|nr:SDR family oxidoreductase [Sphingomonadales bacterium]MBU3991006.1 SDR family oxidoreductase [Alphaproteobacteria bacterium]
MDFRIRGRVAFVAGGSKGMGRDAALALGAEGCKVLVVAREQGAIDAVVAEIKAAGGEAAGISADLCTQDGVAKALDTCNSLWSMPDIVVSQTNDTQFGKALSMDPAILEDTFRVLTMSAVYLAQATIPAMQARKWGRFVHIGSIAAREPERHFPHAAANVARPATSGFLKTLASEVAADGVTVNTIAPGWTLTPSLEMFFGKSGWTIDQGNEWLRKTIGVPAARAGTSEELGSTVAFLCSEQAGYITGTWIPVDGGNHASIM